MAFVGNADEFCAVLGPTAFRVLVEVRGGTGLWVPANINDADRLVQWLGMEAATRLIEAYGGFEIKVPNLRTTKSDHRVIPLLNKGMPDWEIAVVAGVTEETVRAVRKRNPTSAVGSNPRATA